MFIIKIKRIKIVTLLINVSDLCAQDLFSLYILRYLEGSMRTQVLNYVETVQSMSGSYSCNKSFISEDNVCT